MSEGIKDQNDGGARDQLDAELRKLLSGDASEPRLREPSAKERAKLAKDRRKQQKSALKQQRKTRRRRRATQTAAWALAVIILAGAGTFAYLRFGHPAGGPDDTRTVANGAVPPGTSAAPLIDSGPPSDPFGGTPADKWANGAAGITIPAAKPIGQYSAAQVEDAYQTTKKLLIAAALNPQTLHGGAPTAFAKLLTQDQRSQFLNGLNKIGLDKNHEALSTRSWINQFAPGTTKLIGSVIKVHGTMTAAATRDQNGNNVLRVSINYLIAYPVEPPNAPADWMRVVTQFHGPVDFGSWANAESPFEPWWSPAGQLSGVRCDTKDGFLHPEFPRSPTDTTPEKGPIVNPYSLSQPDKDGCGAITGT